MLALNVWHLTLDVSVRMDDVNFEAGFKMGT